MAIVRTRGTAVSVSKHVVGLDALRVFACLAVLAVHFGMSMWVKGNNPGGSSIRAFDSVQPYVSFGWVGVQIFFVLSGFVIAYSAFSAGAAHFLTQRMARLMPALVLCSTFTGLVLLAFHRYTHAELLRKWMHSVTFYPKADLIDDSHWTLSLEMSFYLLVFAILLMRRSDLITRVLAGLGVMSTVLDVAVVMRRHLSPGAAVVLIRSFQKLPYNQGHFVRHGCYFSLGVFLWLLLFRGVTPGRVAMVALTMVGGCAEIVERARELSAACMLPIAGSTPLLVWLAALLAIYGCVRYNGELQARLGERGAAVLRTLGLMTYPLYLLHQAFGKAMIVFLEPRVGGGFALTLTLAMVFGLSLALALYVEPPLQRAVRSAAPSLYPARVYAAVSVPAGAAWGRLAQAGAAWRYGRNREETVAPL